MAFAGQYHPTGCGPQAADGGNRQTQHRPDVQLEFAQVLADEGDQSRVVGPGRELGEHHFFGSLGSTEKELHPKQASPTQVVRHLAGHRLGGLQLGCSHGGRLPAALVIAPLLEVANRWAKQGGSIPLTHRQQGDLQAEA